MTKSIRLEVSTEEMEMIQTSVAERLKIWETTKEFLDGGVVTGLIEDCHKSEEADWMIERYKQLISRLEFRAS